MFTRVLLVVLILLLPWALAHAYSVSSSWSYTDTDSSGSWDPGEPQWWDYTLTWGGNDATPYYFAVYVGSRVTADMLTDIQVLVNGSPWTESWSYSVTEGAAADDATRVLWSTTYLFGFPSGTVFRFYDNLGDKTTLLNVVGPHDNDVAWGTGVAASTTTAVWNGNPATNNPDYQQTGDYIAVTPEPGALGLVGFGLLALVALRRKKD